MLRLEDYSKPLSFDELKQSEQCLLKTNVGKWLVIPLTTELTNWSEKVLDIGLWLAENAAIKRAGAQRLF